MAPDDNNSTNTCPKFLFDDTNIIHCDQLIFKTDEHRIMKEVSLINLKLNKMIELDLIYGIFDILFLLSRPSYILYCINVARMSGACRAYYHLFI